ncbi:MAG TPA: Bax inhibitor-1 family protein [Solirubrobacteraceae bacterium]|jgi:FtsH-binding integral membrane protein|nr:Bax inhibitor-1 family protein [Solirubrobacteraceae bacterium]
MAQTMSPFARRVGARTTSDTLLLGQVMFLVAVALAFTTLGTYLGRDLSIGTARICSFVGFGMLIVSSFGGRVFRVGPFAMGWLYALALMIGIGLGPIIQYFAHVNPDSLYRAAGGTALTVVGMGALGFTMSKDLLPWLRPLSFALFGVVIASVIMLVLGDSSNHQIIDLAVYGISAVLLMVDFNVLRRYGDEESAIPLATGIFVSIINIFVSLLNLFSSD